MPGLPSHTFHFHSHIFWLFTRGWVDMKSYIHSNVRSLKHLNPSCLWSQGRSRASNSRRWETSCPCFCQSGQQNVRDYSVLEDYQLLFCPCDIKPWPGKLREEGVYSGLLFRGSSLSPSWQEGTVPGSKWRVLRSVSMNIINISIKSIEILFYFWNESDTPSE